MPMRIGFSELRRQMLEKELENIVDMLPQLGLVKVILTGDMVTGDYAPDSRIELIVVQETELPYVRRADFFSYHLNSSVAVDTQVYTPDEFEQYGGTLPSLKLAREKGRVIFDGG